MQAAQGVCEHQNAELVLAELLWVFPGKRELQIVPGLFLPDRKCFVAKIDFEERGVDAGQCRELDIAIRDEAEPCDQWLMEAEPALELHFWNRNVSELQSAVDFID